MKTFTKIFILFIVIVGAVAGILCFYNTVMAPPTDSEITNLHKQSLEDKINELSACNSEQNIAKTYNAIIEELDLYRKEFMYNREVYADAPDKDKVYQAITFTEYELNDITTEFADTYIPIFYDQCNKKFSNSIWDNSDLTIMRQHINQLKQLKADYRLTYQENDKLQKVDDIIKDYYNAKRLADNPRFYSVEDAREKIRKADEYRTKSPLSNCKELRESLANVKKEIGESHYKQIQVAVERYCSINTDQAYLSAKNLIDSYNSNQDLYGTDTQANISIKTYNSQWIETQYGEYMSDSNKGKPNSTATMYFMLTGYKEFSFKIKSNSESNFDYVMVRLDKMPTTDSNYSSTKGTQDWKEVTWSNLSPSTLYIIYVVYHKDGTVNCGEDRGYVQIPIQQKLDN